MVNYVLIQVFLNTNQVNRALFIILAPKLLKVAPPNFLFRLRHWVVLTTQAFKAEMYAQLSGVPDLLIRSSKSSNVLVK